MKKYNCYCKICDIYYAPFEGNDAGCPLCAANMREQYLLELLKDNKISNPFNCAEELSTPPN